MREDLRPSLDRLNDAGSEHSERKAHWEVLSKPRIPQGAGDVVHAFKREGTPVKRTRTRNAFANNPFLLWFDLAMKTGQMMIASAQVIDHRTRRMAAAGSNPNARDRREFALMGQEKIEAAAKSAQSMAAHMMTVDPLLGVRAVQQSLATATAMMSLAGSRTVSQALARQAKLVRTMTKSAGTASRISHSSARLAHRGLTPIHARATANAKRLGKR